jgi:hypothetical protein
MPPGVSPPRPTQQSNRTTAKIHAAAAVTRTAGAKGARVVRIPFAKAVRSTNSQLPGRYYPARPGDACGYLNEGDWSQDGRSTRMEVADCKC